MPSFSMFLSLSMIKLKNSALNFRERMSQTDNLLKLSYTVDLDQKATVYFLGKFMENLLGF